jgi:hypothetical protein
MKTAPGTTVAADDITTATADRKALLGIARIREMQKFQQAGLMAETAHEGNTICDLIARAISDAYFSDSSTAAAVAASDSVRDMADEAYRLLTLAAEQLRDLTRDPDEPPF